MAPFAQVFAIIGLALGTGAATVSVLNGDVPDMAVPDHPWTDAAPLDGMAFDIVAQLDNGAEGETDTLIFRDGGFHSVDCELYCEFGFSDYRTWTEGEVIHFTATALCPTAPHTVVWYGQVVGDDVTVEMSWTTRRWYWTHQIMGTGTGSRGAVDGPVSG